jgi:hypothetical protein
VSLKHKLVNFTSMCHDLLAIFWQKEAPSIQTAVGSLDHMCRVFFYGNLWCYRYRLCRALYGANEIREGGKLGALGGELAAVELLDGSGLGDIL